MVHCQGLQQPCWDPYLGHVFSLSGLINIQIQMSSLSKSVRQAKQVEIKINLHQAPMVKPLNRPLLVNWNFSSRSFRILWKSAVSRYIEKRARYAWQICKWKSDRRFLANVIAARAIFYTRDDKIIEFHNQFNYLNLTLIL